MASLDLAWQRMKDEAYKCAREGRRFSSAQAEYLVIKIMRQCFVSPMPDREAMAFFVQEMQRMVEESRPAAEAPSSADRG